MGSPEIVALLSVTLLLFGWRRWGTLGPGLANALEEFMNHMGGGPPAAHSSAAGQRLQNPESVAFTALARLIVLNGVPQWTSRPETGHTRTGDSRLQQLARDRNVLRIELDDTCRGYHDRNAAAPQAVPHSGLRRSSGRARSHAAAAQGAGLAIGDGGIAASAAAARRAPNRST